MASEPDLTAVADELYALTPVEFTQARNDRAKQTKPEDKSLAAAIAGLPKPSTAAWVVNALVRHSADELEQVLTLGEALRRAQENLDGVELRELNKQRRQLTAAVTAQARRLARELGVTVSAAVATQVEETLRAAMTDQSASRAVRTGQLVQALAATGVGELDVSAAVAVPEALGFSARPVERPKPRLTIVEDESESADQQERLLEEAEQSATAATAAAAKAEKKLEKARKKFANLQARSLQLQGELEEVRRRAGELEHDVEVVEDELSAAEEKRDRAEQKQAAARDAAEEAQTALTKMQ